MPSEFYKSIPLSLTGSGAAKAQIDPSFEEWYGHEAGEGLFNKYDSVGSRYWGNLTSTADSSTDSVGSYTDTFYNEAIGTHPGTSLSVGSVTTKLHMMVDSADASPANVFVAADSNGDIYEMDSASVIKLGTRLAEQMHSNEFTGSFRLGSTAPNADYSIWDSVVFSDTLTNSTTEYHIWRRFNCESPTAPASNALRLTSSDSANLQEMTPSELQSVAVEVLLAGQEASGVGSYQLRSSTQGAPTDPGTWVARGVALDTRNTTQNIQYTSAQYTTVPYSRQYAGQYVGQYTGLSYADVPTDYTGFRQVLFTGPRSYASDYAGDRNFVGNYIGFRAYTGIWTGNFGPDYTGGTQYSGSRNYASNEYVSAPEQFTGTRQYTGPKDYTGNYSDDYAGSRTADYAGSRGKYINFSGNYSGSRTYPDNRVTYRVVNGAQNWTGTNYRSQNFVGISYYPRTYPGNANYRPVNYSGTNPDVCNTINIKSTPVTFCTPGNTNYRPATFTGSNPPNYAAFSNQNFRNVQYAGNNSGTTYFTIYYVGYWSGFRTFSSNNYGGSRANIVYFGGDYAGTSFGDFAGSRQRTYTGTDQYTTAPTQFVGTRQYTGSRNYADNYANDIQYTGLLNWIGDRYYSGNYGGDRNYAGQYGGSRSYTGQFLGPQEQQFVGIVPTEYTAQYTTQYTGQYTSSYTAQYSSQYTGETLIALTETIESYTLYCKISES